MADATETLQKTQAPAGATGGLAGLSAALGGARVLTGAEGSKVLAALGAMLRGEGAAGSVTQQGAGEKDEAGQAGGAAAAANAQAKGLAALTALLGGGAAASGAQGSSAQPGLAAALGTNAAAGGGVSLGAVTLPVSAQGGMQAPVVLSGLRAGGANNGLAALLGAAAAGGASKALVVPTGGGRVMVVGASNVKGGGGSGGAALTPGLQGVPVEPAAAEVPKVGEAELGAAKATPEEEPPAAAEPAMTAAAVEALPPGAPPDTLHSGAMEKLGGFVKNWKRRLFCLTPMTLFYYAQSSAGLDQKGAIPLLGAQLDETGDEKRPHSFSIITTKRRWLLDPGSAEGRVVWMDKIASVLPVSS